MRALRLWALLLFCLGCLGACAADPGPAQPDWRLASANELAPERHLIVTVDLADPDRLAATAAELERTYGVTLAAEWPLLSISVHCFVFAVPAGGEVSDVIARMDGDPVIRIAQPMQSFGTLAEPYADDLFPLQTGLSQINAAAVRAVATGRDVLVGIVDTAVDFGHPDLSSREAMARDFVSADGTASLGEEHGTAIAGVIAADARNAFGIVGVAPEARLMGLRGCWETADGRGRCSSFSLARALNFALLNDVDVLNMSLAGPDDPLLAEILVSALGAGIIVVAAEGLSAEANFPASMEGVIAVGPPALLLMDDALAAPGVDVLSTAPGQAFDFYSGSSIAAAHISGVAALILERSPGIEPQALARALAAGAAPEAERSGALIFDSCAALAAAGGDTVTC